MTEIIDSVDLEAVEDFLRAQQPEDGEVLSFDWRTSRIYLDLDLKPPHPHMTPSDLLAMWPRRYPSVLDELAKTRQKFVVFDLKAVPVPEAEDPASRTLTLPHSFPDKLRGDFPWSLPIVFRRGRYIVHRVLGPCGWLTPNPPPAGNYEKVHGLIAFRKGPRIGIAERDGEPVLFESLHQQEPMHWWQPRYRIVPLTKAGREDRSGGGGPVAALRHADRRKHAVHRRSRDRPDSIRRAECRARSQLRGPSRPTPTIVDAYFPARRRVPKLRRRCAGLRLAVRWTPAAI